MSTPPATFTTDAELLAAHERWGANCGPAALAAACGLPIDSVRPALPAFGRTGYTNVRMMHEAIAVLGFRASYRPDFAGRNGATAAFPAHGLVRLQFGGPRTGPGASERWASCHTHWVASKSIGEDLWVYDVNGGWWPRGEWEAAVVTAIVRSKDRADGTWWPTHRWEVRRGRPAPSNPTQHP